MAGGADQPLTDYSNCTITEATKGATTCSPPPQTLTVTDWFPEYTYEPYKLKAMPNSIPKNCAMTYAGDPGSCSAASPCSTCCDGSTLCSNIVQTPCIMGTKGIKGWVSRVFAQTGAAMATALSSHVGKLPRVFITIGTMGNADCQFSPSDIPSVIQTLCTTYNPNTVKNICIYTR